MVTIDGGESPNQNHSRDLVIFCPITKVSFQYFVATLSEWTHLFPDLEQTLAVYPHKGTQILKEKEVTQLHKGTQLAQCAATIPDLGPLMCPPS